MTKQKLPYTAFAWVYDKTMNEIPYHHWAYYIYGLFENNKLGNDDWVVDVGAGTGVVAAKLAAYYNLVAVDISRGMLEYARQNEDLKCIQADMLKLPFASGKVAAAYSTHDCLNYLTTEAMLKDHFQEMHRILKPGGLYIFDYSTEYNVMRNFNNRVFSERHGKYHMRWSNTYDRQNRTVTSIIDVTEHLPGWLGYAIFWKKKKIREIHVQKVFGENTLQTCLKSAGFEIVKKDYDYNEGVRVDHAHIVVYVLRKTN